MAELDIGKHCTLPECKQLDFLPFVCDGCGLTFCKEHQVKDRHSCSKSEVKTSDVPSTPYKTYACTMTGCNRSELVPVSCDMCHSNYCMIHRHTSDHHCTAVVPKPKYMSATAEHVQGIVAAAPRRISKAPKSKKAQAMAAKVALMKLKQTSKGDEGIPMESRVYVNVQLPVAGVGAKAKYSAHWLDPEWTVGRSVDYISDKAKVRNDNNKANCPKLHLRSVEGNLYAMDTKVKDLLADQQLHNGSTIEMCYISNNT